MKRKNAGRFAHLLSSGSSVRLGAWQAARSRPSVDLTSKERAAAIVAAAAMARVEGKGREPKGLAARILAAGKKARGQRV